MNRLLVILGVTVGLLLGIVLVAHARGKIDWRCMQRCIARGSMSDYCEAMCSR